MQSHVKSAFIYVFSSILEILMMLTLQPPGGTGANDIGVDCGMTQPLWLKGQKKPIIIIIGVGLALGNSPTALESSNPIEYSNPEQQLGCHDFFFSSCSASCPIHSSYLLPLFLVLISFLLFPCASVWENTHAWVIL